MSRSVSEPVEVSKLHSFLEEIFSRFDEGEINKDEYVFSGVWIEDDNFRETVEEIAIEVVEDNNVKTSSMHEQITFFRQALVDYFEYRVLFIELLRVNSEEDRKEAGKFIWQNEFNDFSYRSLDEIMDDILYFYQACEALYCIFKELLMKFFNEGYESNYPKKHLGLLIAYYRIGIRSVIDKKNKLESNLSDIIDTLKESSEKEKKQFTKNHSLLQTPSLVEDFRELCTNVN